VYSARTRLNFNLALFGDAASAIVYDTAASRCIPACS
jgi:hypothetical protein